MPRSSHLRLRTPTASAAAAAVLAAALGSASPAAAPAAAVARTEVHLRPRADLSQEAWIKRTNTYDNAYVYPDARPLRLDSCASTIDGVPAAESPAPGPAWRLEPLDAQLVGAIDIAPVVGRCARTVGLPALGRWRITTTVRDAAGRTATLAQRRSFRDVVVAAVGDSFTSGEGNKLEGWVDGQCHRSYEAWPQQLARSLEGATTAVTFLSFACTGAEIRHLVDAKYSGAGDGPAELEPQLRALRRVLGDPVLPGTRAVDVLLGTAGINALGVAKVLEECSVKHPATVCRRNVRPQLATLPGLYDRLELGLTENVRVGRAYFVGYPARIFTNSQDEYETCGVFSTMDVPEDAQWVDEQVSTVNRRLAQAARRHGWRVAQTRDLFRTHGYCAQGPLGSPRATWFRSRESSLHGQGNKAGTAHPNLQGQRATARHVRAIVRTDVAAPAPVRFAVRFLRIRVTDRLPVPWPGQLSVSLAPRLRGACGHFTETVTGLERDVWNDVSSHPCLRFDVRTAGRTVRLGASTFVNAVQKPPGEPPQDEDQGPGRPPSARPGPISFGFERFLRRARGWEATPPRGPRHVVHRFTASRGGARVELEYEITRPEHRETGAAP